MSTDPLDLERYLDPPVRGNYTPASNSWSLDSGVAKLKEAFPDLPISVFGQGAAHNRNNWDHRNAIDVGWNPTSPNGQKLVAYLQANGIPFSTHTSKTFNARGQMTSSGPHIHVGPASHYTTNTFPVGATLDGSDPLGLENYLEPQDSIKDVIPGLSSIPDVPVSTIQTPQVIKPGKPRYEAIKTENLERIPAKKGETLIDIASKYKVGTRELAQINGMVDWQTPFTGGEVIRVPVTKTVLRPTSRSYYAAQSYAASNPPKPKVSIADVKRAEDEAGYYAPSQDTSMGAVRAVDRADEQLKSDIRAQLEQERQERTSSIAVGKGQTGVPLRPITDADVDERFNEAKAKQNEQFQLWQSASPEERQYVLSKAWGIKQETPGSFMKGFRVGGHSGFSTLDRRLANLSTLPDIDEQGKVSAPGTGYRRQADLRDLAMQMAAEPEDSGFWYGLGQGTGSMAIELPQLLAGGAILKGATLPVLGALSAKSPSEAIENAVTGYFFHKGMAFTAPLGRIKNALVWTTLPTVQSKLEGKSWGESLGQGLTFGSLALMGEKRAEVIEDGVRRPAKVSDLSQIRSGKLQLAPPEITPAELRTPVDASEVSTPYPVKGIRDEEGKVKSLVSTNPFGAKPRFYAGESGIIDPSVPVWRMGGEGDTRQLLPSEVQSLDPASLKYNDKQKRYEYDPRVSSIDELFDKPAQTRSLSQFARQYGVKADDVNSGEVRRLSNKETGTTGIVRRNGISADRLAEKAWEEGYYRERPDPNQLLEDIEADLSGRRKIYAQPSEFDYEAEFRKAYPDDARVVDGIKALESDPVGGKLYDLISNGDDPYGRNERLFRSIAGEKGLEPEDINAIVESAKHQTGQATEDVSGIDRGENGQGAGVKGSSLEAYLEPQGKSYNSEDEIDAIIAESKNQLEGDASFNPSEFEGRITPDLRGIVRGALEFGRDIYQAGMSLVDFTKRMVSRLGEKVKPYLDSIYSRVKAFHEDERGFLGIGRGVLRSGNIAELSTSLNMALRKGAGVRGQVGNIRAGAWPLVDRELQRGKLTRPEFTSALITNRLTGIRDAYTNLASDAQTLLPDQLERAYTESYSPLLDELSDKATFSGQVQRFGDLRVEGDHFLDEAKRTGDYSGLRNYLEQTFNTAGKAVETMHLTPAQLAEYQKVTSNPAFPKALASYKKNVESVLDTSHAENKGYFTSARGPLDTYYPLVPQVEKLDAQGNPTGIWENMKIAAGLTPGVNAVAPRNPGNHFATGLNPQYDASMEGFNQRLFRALSSNSKASAVRTLESTGWGKVLKPKEDVPEVFDGPNGLKYTVATVPTNGPTINGERTVRQMVVPEFIKDKWEDIFPSSGRPTSPGRVKQAMSALMHLTLATPTELTTHITNMAALTATDTGILPPQKPSLVGKGVSAVMSNPITKAMYVVHRTLAIDPSSPEMVQRTQWLADRGLVPDKYAQLTVSSKLAESTGAKLTRNPLNIGAVALYGPRGYDLRARLFLDKVFTDTYPNASEAERVKFNQKLPNYVRALQSKFERSIKDSGLAPFYTAGSTVYKAGVKSLIPGQSLFEVPRSASKGKALGNSLSMELTGRVTGLAALWAIGHVAITGKWPWDDKNSRLMQWPVPDSIRHTEIGEAIWGKDGQAYFDLSAFNPAVNRGLRAVGAQKAYDVGMAGGSSGQVGEYAATQAMNTGANVLFTGPAVRFAFTTLSGREPYSSGPRDDRGQFDPLANLMPATNKEEPGWKQALALLGSSVVGTNSLLGKALEDSGLTYNSGKEQANRWFQLLPLVGRAVNTYDPSMMTVRLAKERGLSEDNAQKETRKDLIQRSRQGENVKSETKADVQSGVLTGRDRRTIRREGKQDDLQSLFDSLSPKEALDAYESLSPDKQKEVRRQLMKKRMSLQNLPVGERKELRERFNRVLTQ